VRARKAARACGPSVSEPRSALDADSGGAAGLGPAREAQGKIAAVRAIRSAVAVWPLAAGFALLALLDALRARLGPTVRPWQWAAALLAVLLVAFWLRKRGFSRREALPILGLAVLLAPTYVDRARLLASDGTDYYSYLRSLLFDADLDLRNDYELLGVDENKLNVLPIGAPLFWSPVVGAFHLVRQGLRLAGASPPTGVEPEYQAMACLATLAVGAAGLFLLQGVLRRFASPGAAFWATVLVWVGSPLRFYLSVLPGLAHGVEFFAAVLVLRTALALRDAPGTRAALQAGGACGLVFLTRSQDGLLLGLPGLFLLHRLLTHPERRQTSRLLVLLAVGFAVAALPQILVWQAMYGVPILVPHKLLHGEAFLHLDAPQLAGTLFSSRGGLFTLYPILLVACLGLLRLLPRDPVYVVSVAPVLLAGWYLNSTVFDWYQVRRFTGIVPLLAPGLAVLLVPLARAGIWPLALVALLTLRYDVAVDGLRALPGEPAPVRQVLARMGDDLARDGYAVLEPLAPRSAVRLLAVYTGEPLLLESNVSWIELSRPTAYMRLPRPARGLSQPSVEDGEACRWVEDGTEAMLFLPLAREGAVVVTLRARALETPEPMTMQALWNDAVVAAWEVEPRWADYRFKVEAPQMRSGTNTLQLRFDKAPVYRRVRGVGPRRLRPAALALVTLHAAP